MRQPRLRTPDHQRNDSKCNFRSVQRIVYPDVCHSSHCVQQLQDMGFTNAAQNVRALLATGGNVHAAIEYILGGGGI